MAKRGGASVGFRPDSKRLIKHMARKQPRKPSGESEQFRVNLSTKEITWTTFRLPSDKVEAETLVADLFATCLPDGEKAVLGTLGSRPSDIVKRLPEQDHDFRLIGEKQEWIVQLTELILVETFRGDYENAPSQFTYGEIADCFVKQVLQKSAKYGRIEGRLILVMYASDQKFAFKSSNLDRLITHYLKKTNNSHIFDRSILCQSEIPILLARD